MSRTVVGASRGPMATGRPGSPAHLDFVLRRGRRAVQAGRDFLWLLKAVAGPESTLAGLGEGRGGAQCRGPCLMSVRRRGAGHNRSACAPLQQGAEVRRARAGTVLREDEQLVAGIFLEAAKDALQPVERWRSEPALEVEHPARRGGQLRDQPGSAVRQVGLIGGRRQQRHHRVQGQCRRHGCRTRHEQRADAAQYGACMTPKHHRKELAVGRPLLGTAGRLLSS
mmetsp:Transcript_24479/g.78989  ORF Transcript_24479/g.78989 Transcript_24479/m.78989 type:complete len:225 (-) Transcript_24479:31-705(-)